MHFTKYDKDRNCQAYEFNDRISMEVVSVMPVLRLTMGGGAGKLLKRGVKTNQKCLKRGAKLINEEVTKGKKGMIFQGKIFLEEKLQKYFQGVIFLG